MKLHIVILGGGIRGTAIAALLAQNNCCNITLLERYKIASGTTSTNQGRLHTGAMLWWTGFDNVIERHRIGAELLYQLPGVVEKQEQGIYLIETAEDAIVFEKACQKQSIAHKKFNLEFMEKKWINSSQFFCAYALKEYFFNPASLAGRFAAYAKSLGANIHTQSVVQAIEPVANGSYRVHLANGSTISADIVVNTLGNWANHIRSELPLPQLSLEWHRWRILCLNTLFFSESVALNSLITIINKRNRLQSAIPHNPWITFGCSVPPKLIDHPTSPDDQEDIRWRRFDKNQEIDKWLLEVHAQYFLPLKSISIRELHEALFSFSGTYPYLEDSEKYPFQIRQTENVPNYYVVYGQNATTALIDAIDFFKFLIPKIETRKGSTLDISQLLSSMFENFNMKTYPESAKMIWEDQM